MNRRMLGVVIAVVLGALGTFVLVEYVRGAQDHALAGEKTVNVLVATQVVDAGTAAEDLVKVTRTERVPEKVLAKDAVTRLKDVRGLITTTDLVAGEQILRTRLAQPGQVSKGVGSVKVPQGYVEITLSLEPERAVGGLIRPGSKVVAIGTAAGADKNASTSGVLAHQVLVTNVQAEDRSGEPTRDETRTIAPTRNLLITLAVDDAAAAKILAFAENGNVWLGAEQKLLTGSTGK